MKRIIICALIFAVKVFPQNSDPLIIAKRIADRIINETTFELINEEQKPALGIQVIDFRKAFAGKNEKFALALAKIEVKNEMILHFGISYSSPLKIWINDKLVFQDKSKTEFQFKEIAYSIFSFQDTIALKLNKGTNKIAIGSSLEGNPVVFMRELTGAEENSKSKFLPVDLKAKYTWPWCFVNLDSLSNEDLNAIFSSDINKEKNSSNKNNFSALLTHGHSLKLILPKPKILKHLKVKKGAAFKKDSYAEWNYANGAMMMALIELSHLANGNKYLKFVQRYCDFTLENLSLFKEQYCSDHDFRGTGHRIFRKSMLDDAGAPVLPYIELELMNHDKKYDSLITVMTEYVMNKQARLEDGTLCRPEPDKWTIWADDLFMAVPLLLRMGKLTGQEIYFDEAVKQIINFNKYLFDESKGLYKHGWFSITNKKSNVFWGRANGWVIWAESEALLYLPKENPNYTNIKNIFVKHLNGLLKYQDEDGMWHQVLDDKSSFEETSCTAMFTLGLCRAIEHGWIEEKFVSNVESAWNALQKRISKNGIVIDICGGTGIGNSVEFYRERKKYKNDPRGLGAVIAAAIEVKRLNDYITGK